MSVTEKSSSITKDLDKGSSSDIVRLLAKANEELFSGLYNDDVASKVKEISVLFKDSLIVLSGCGTSGRIAFFCSHLIGDNVKYCMSGGDKAFLLPVENAEDNPHKGVEDLLNVVGDAEKVVFVGITCGLSAPYVAGQLDYALKHRDRFHSVLLGFNPIEGARNAAIEGWNGRTFRDVAQEMKEKAFVLNPIIGPEPVTGSTRMKGGTATKVLLEMLFSCAGDSSLDALNLVKAYERASVMAYEGNEDAIGEIIDVAAETLRAKKRIRYVASDLYGGMLGLIDASECPPTFGAKTDDVKGYISRDWPKLMDYSSLEDFFDFAPNDGDLLIVLSMDKSMTQEEQDAVNKAKKAGCTVRRVKMVSKRENFEENCVNVLIHESNERYAQLELKLVLNAITTGAFVLVGKIYGNRMIDLRLSNNKLYHRAIGIVKEIAQVDEDKARECIWRAIYRNDTKNITLETPISKHIECASKVEKIVPVSILLAKGFDYEKAIELLQKHPQVRNALNSV